MRLGQLSRKLGVRSSEIVGFLQAKGINIDDNANSKISDSDSRMIAAHLAPGIQFDEPSLEEVAEIPIEEIPSVQEPQPPIGESEPLVSETGSTEVYAPELPEPLPETEVIKAPKVELQGLKVIGKIELPVPRKKETPTDDGAAAEPTSQRQERRSGKDRKIVQHANQKSENRPRKNPIAAQRERAEREAEEIRKAEQKREKETRTQYYLQKVKPSPPARKINLVDEPLTQLHEEAPDEPKTFWGKFMKWLTSY